MLYDSFWRYLITKRCWKIYNLVADAFEMESSFHAEYPVAVEEALITGQLLVQIAPWFIQEEYLIEVNKLVVTDYSYILLDKHNHPIIRADSAPHHQIDYRGQHLSNFPHHLHDDQGRICHFSGKIEDFIDLTHKFIVVGDFSAVRKMLSLK